jgi:hypothetical protein
MFPLESSCPHLAAVLTRLRAGTFKRCLSQEGSAIMNALMWDCRSGLAIMGVALLQKLPFAHILLPCWEEHEGQRPGPCFCTS